MFSIDGKMLYIRLWTPGMQADKRKLQKWQEDNLGAPCKLRLKSNSDAEKDTCRAVLEGTAYCMFSLTTRANYDRIWFELCQKTVSNRSDLFTYNSKV